MRTIAIFDFDGTLTRKDTFIEFIRFCHGSFKLYLGLILLSHYLISYKLGLYPNYKAKQKVFSFFFKGMRYENFYKKGISFSSIIPSFLKQEQMKKLKEHQEYKHDIYIVSASIKEWIMPWCELNGINNIICTEIEVDKNQLLTGKFKTQNCYGAEKVKRFVEIEPNRNNYYLYAYGDSRGDKAILNFADKGMMCK